MTDQELTSRLQEVLEALIDQVAAGLAPVLRGLVQEAVTARLDAPAVNRATGVAEVRLAPTDLRPSLEAG